MASSIVIPAKAGTQHSIDAASRQFVYQVWAPAYAGVTESGHV